MLHIIRSCFLKTLIYQSLHSNWPVCILYINVLLDMVFLFWFQMGVFGAALASVIATAAACILGFARLHGTGSFFGVLFQFRTGNALRILQLQAVRQL